MDTNTKEAYTQKVEAKVDEWQADIDQLKAKSKEASADAKIELDNKIDSLEKEQSQLGEKLGELKQASEDTWEDFKDGLENAYDSAANTVKDLKSKYLS